MVRQIIGILAVDQRRLVAAASGTAWTKCGARHVYHTNSGKPVAVRLRSSKTFSGVEVRILLKHLTRCIRRHWPRTRLIFQGGQPLRSPRGDDWCEENGVEQIFGLAGNAALHALA